jgi:hypothetical protein
MGQLSRIPSHFDSKSPSGDTGSPVERHLERCGKRVTLSSRAGDGASEGHQLARPDGLVIEVDLLRRQPIESAGDA